MKKSLAFFLMLGAAVPALAQVPVTAAADQAALLKDKNPELAANKKLAFDFLRVVLNAGHTELGDKFMVSDCIEHNPMLPTGRAALLKIFGRGPAREILPTLPGLVAVTADGDLVTIVAVDVENDPRKPGVTYTTSHFDMFRVENGRIAEHWDDDKVRTMPKGGSGGAPVTGVPGAPPPG
jgi:predicted SnoaL-like aldol condensation-catalyzing enzyme